MEDSVKRVKEIAHENIEKRVKVTNCVKENRFTSAEVRRYLIVPACLFIFIKIIDSLLPQLRFKVATWS